MILGDVVDAALDRCQDTLKSKNKESLIDRVRKMAGAFLEDYGVSLDMLEKYAGCKAEVFTEQTIIKLRGVYKSIKDGMAAREQYFDLSLQAEKKDPEKEPEKEGQVPKDTEQENIDDL